MDVKTLGQVIREIRDQRDYSLRELARRVGCSPAFLSDIELGRRFPSRKILNEIAQALGVPLEVLEQHDVRAPIEELRRRSESNPRFAFALRSIADMSQEDLLKLVERVPDHKEKSK